MIKLYKMLEEIWFKWIPQKLRYLLVGGFNTVTAYLIFVLLYLLLNGQYMLSVILQNIISINISVFTMRYYVFQSRGDIMKEYLKASGVYVYLIGFNLAWLYVFVTTLEVNALVAQACYLVVSVTMTYFLHKYFSFSKKSC